MKYFLEIGSADFDPLLPLCDLGSQGICVEPVEVLAQNLREEVKSKGYPVEVLDCAVSHFDGEAELVAVTAFDWDEENSWAKGVSHLSSKHDDGQWCGRLLENVNQIIPREYRNVQCQTLNSLINYIKNESVVFRGFENTIDFMRIDTEGQEVNILKAYDWEIKPKVIKVEHAHCDRDELIKILRDQKYFTQEEEYDIYGLL